jgi:agmatinase
VSYKFSDSPQADRDKAKVHLLPVPLEATVSYEGGTKQGPDAILRASFQLENYDREFDCEPGPQYGIHTLPAMDLPSQLEEAHQQITERVGQAYSPDKLLGVLGGEHSLTGAVVKGLLPMIEGPLTVVQLDAHCDLRDSYEGTKLSHASVSRRLLELDGVEQLLQFGIRSLCTEEAEVLKTDHRVRVWHPEDLRSDEHLDDLKVAVRGRQVYLTIDVDAFDPAWVPSTGTPEPDGLSFVQAEKIVRVVAEHSRLLAFDCVELAPREGFHAADFFVAKFLYRLMNLCLAKPAEHPIVPQMDAF